MISIGVLIIILIFVVAIIEIGARHFSVPVPVLQILRLLLGLAFILAVLSVFGVVMPAWVYR